MPKSDRRDTVPRDSTTLPRPPSKARECYDNKREEDEAGKHIVDRMRAQGESLRIIALRLLASTR